MRDFKEYARLEAANILLLPGIVIFMASPDNLWEIGTMTLPIISCASFLFIGTVYWRALDKRLNRAGDDAMMGALDMASRAQKPLLFLFFLSLVTTIFSMVSYGLTPVVLGSIFLVVMAGLEYVNYYHYQLMNFDRTSDFARLIKTGKFRRAHMARDLKAFRSKLHQ